MLREKVKNPYFWTFFSNGYFLIRSHSLSIVLVSHDLAVVAQICHRVVVMRHGEIVEWGNTREVIHEPQHAYTRRLIESQPGRLAVVKPAVERAEIGAGAAQAPPLLEIDRLCVEFVLPGAGLPERVTNE